MILLRVCGEVFMKKLITIVFMRSKIPDIAIVNVRPYTSSLHDDIKIQYRCASNLGNAFGMLLMPS